MGTLMCEVVVVKGGVMQEELILFNTEYARVSIDKSSGTGILTWKRQATKDEFWEASYHLMQYISMGSIAYCVFIQNSTIKIPEEHKLWLKYLALPDAKTAGLKRIATLTDDSLPFVKLFNLKEKLFHKQVIPHKSFTDMEELEEWLYYSELEYS